MSFKVALLAKYHWNDKIEDEIGKECSAHGRKVYTKLW
jgi:hypothetical protein